MSTKRMKTAQKMPKRKMPARQAISLFHTLMSPILKITDVVRSKLVIPLLFGGLGLIAAMGLWVFTAHAETLAPGDLIKGSGPDVYFYSKNGTRHAFPSESVFYSWYPDFSSVKTRSDFELMFIPSGTDVPYRSGMRLVKTTDNPKVYAVEGWRLRWITTEEVARDIFGDAWKNRIDDVSSDFLKTYEMGVEIARIVDYIPNVVRALFPSIESMLQKEAPVNNSAQPSVPSLMPEETNDTTPPTMPQDLQVNPLTDQSSLIVWAASFDNVGIASYVVFRDDIQIGETSINRFVDTGLKSGSSYTYTVYAKDASGNISKRTQPKLVHIPMPPFRGGSAPMQVALLADLYEGSGGGGTNSFSTGSFTPTTGGRLIAIVAAMEFDGTSEFSDDLTVTDSQGLTWTAIGDVGNTTAWAIGMRAWISSPVASASSMTVTFDCGAFNMESYQAVVFEVENSDGTITGYVEDSSTAKDGATSVTLASSATTDDLVVYARHFDNPNNPTLDMADGWTVIANAINTGGGGDLGVAINDALSGSAVEIDDISAGAGNQIKGIDFAFIIKAN